MLAGKYIIVGTQNGTLMRYFLALTISVALLAPCECTGIFAGSAQVFATGRMRTTVSAIDVPPVTPATDDHLAVAASTVIESGGCVHRPLKPMSAGF